MEEALVKLGRIQIEFETDFTSAERDAKKLIESNFGSHGEDLGRNLSQHYFDPRKKREIESKRCSQLSHT